MNSKKSIYHSPFFWGVVCFALAIFAQVRFDIWRNFSAKPLDTTYNIYIEPQPIGSETAKHLNFGFREALADYYWLSFIQYYGGGDPSGKYRKLPDLFNNVVALSPKFVSAYETGLVILPGEGYVDQAVNLGKLGMKNNPTSWEMPYYTGLVYHMYKKDFATAGDLFNQAAALPNAPANAKYFAAIYYNKASEREVALQIFKTVYETTDNDFLKERAKKYYDHLSIYFFLQDAANLYKQKIGSYPTDLDLLVSKKIITAVPDDPLNIGFVIKDGQVTEKTK